MRKIKLSRHIQDSRWRGHCPSLPPIIDALERTLPSLPFAKGEVALILTNNLEVQHLNKEYRHKDKPTNVLSFPAYTSLQEKPLILGDIFVAFETVKEEAVGKPFQHHITHLIVHGLLHLLGYDHEVDEDALQMESLEVKILNHLNIPDPYNEHST